MYGSVGLDGFHLNFQFVYSLVSLTGHQILYEWRSRINQMLSEYPVGIFIGQTDDL